MLVEQFVESEQIVGSEQIARRGALNLSEMKFSMHSASKNAIWIYLLYLNVHHSINKQRNMRSKIQLKLCCSLSVLRKKNEPLVELMGRYCFIRMSKKINNKTIHSL